MNTTRPVWASTPSVTTTHGRTAPVCRCGQDLDVCSRSHCPRCGRTLVAAVSVAWAA